VSEAAAIQAAIRADAMRNREVVVAGPFVCTFSESANPFLNYAIPDADASPSAEDVAALVEAFGARSRKPRLEYVPSLAPAVAAALGDAGFEVELRTPLMVFRVGDGVAAPDGISLSEVREPADAWEAAGAQFEAYGETEPPSESWVQSMLASVEAGGVLVLARDVATGGGVGAGACTAPHESACELTSVGVRERYRRRGIAAAITSRLAHVAKARGVQTVFLMAHGEAEARIYERVGFERIGEVLHTSRSTRS